MREKRREIKKRREVKVRLGRQGRGKREEIEGNRENKGKEER